MSSSLMSKGKFRIIKRFARLGASLGIDWGLVGDEEEGAWVEVDATGFWKLSTRFLRVAEIIEPLKMCAWRFLTASWAALGSVNNAYARVVSSFRHLDPFKREREEYTLSRILFSCLQFRRPVDLFNTVLLPDFFPHGFGIDRGG